MNATPRQDPLRRLRTQLEALPGLQPADRARREAAFARFFEMEAAPPGSMNLASSMGDKGPLWEKIVASHGLKPYAYSDIVSWAYGDIVFSTGHDIISDTVKARHFGFHEVISTEEMFLQVFESYRKNRIIP